MTSLLKSCVFAGVITVSNAFVGAARIIYFSCGIQISLV